MKNLKRKLRPDEAQKFNSPWNIAADFNVEMSFNASDISGMLREYAWFDGDFHCLEMDIRIKTDTDEGILWYDYDESGGQARYLFAGNYLTDNDMIVEVRPLKRAP